MRTLHRIASGTAGSLGGLAVLAAIAYAASSAGTPPAITGGNPVGVSLDRTTSAVSLLDAAVGDSTSGALGVSNSGSVAADYALSGALAAGSSAALAGQLRLTVYKDADNSASARIFDGRLSGFNAGAPLSLGLLDAPCQGAACAAPGKPKPKSGMTLFFHVSLPSTGTDAGDNALQGRSATEGFTVTATQHTGP